MTHTRTNIQSHTRIHAQTSTVTFSWTTIAGVAFFLFVFAVTGEALQAQGFLDKLIDKTVDKTTEKVTEDVSESASDKAAEESSEAVETWLDGLFEDSEQSEEPVKGYPGASGEGGANNGAPAGMDEQQMHAMMEQMMGGMDKSADVPETYSFDLVMDIEIWQTDEDPEQIQLMVTTDGALFGVAMQDPESGQMQTSVIDSDNGLMAVFSTDDQGNKTAAALPNMMEMAAQYGQGEQEQAETEFEAYGFRPTGRTKSVAGYTCKEYEGETADEEAKFYLSTEVPQDWMKTFMSGFGANAPMAHMHPYGGLKGTLLESHVTDINTGETTSWITTKVDRSGMTIRKADYTFSMAGME